MTKHTLEVVEFRLNNNVQEDAFITQISKTDAFLSSLNGFIKRNTAKNEDGLWIDIVEWQDMKSAKNAAEKFMTVAETKEFGAMIDHKTIRMEHFEVKT